VSAQSCFAHARLHVHLLVCQRFRPLLSELESKLFAIRHPRLLKRVAKKHVEAEREQLLDGSVFRLLSLGLDF